MSGLKQLLIDLGKDAKLQDEYQKGPEKIMRRYECTDEEVKAMLAKDVDGLKRLSGLENLQSNHTIKSYDNE